MASDSRRRQKKLEKRTAKRKEKHSSLVRIQNGGLPGKLADSIRFPVLHSWVSDDLWTQGMGWAAISRELPNAMVAVALFLIDRSCLGVKNAMADIVGQSTYEMRYYHKLRARFSVRDMPPEGVRKIVEASVAYAADLGLAPHADYQVAKLLFGDIDAGASSEEIEFGRDGKPFFVAGPNDSPSRCRQILAKLKEKCGRDGFHYMIPVIASEAAKYLPNGVDPGDGTSADPEVDQERGDSPVDLPVTS